jgi:hypothetical protein
MPRRRTNRARHERVLPSGRPCHRCGYDLAGLPYGGACPECGTPIHAPRGSGKFVDTLADAPAAYLRQLCVGLTLMAASGVGLAAALLCAQGPWRYYGSAWAVVLSGCWFAGVCLATQRRPVSERTILDPVLESDAFRWAIRGSQLTWPVVAIALAVAAFLPLLVTAAPPTIVPGAVTPPTPTPSGVILARRVALIGQGLALLSLPPLGVFLCALAAWSGDTGLADRIRTSLWAMVVGGVFGAVGTVLAPLGLSLSGLFAIAGMLGWGTAMLGAVLLMASVVQLAYLSWWALRNAASQAEVEIRLARRRAEHEAMMAARTQTTMDAAKRTQAPSPVAPDSRPPVARLAFDEKTVPRPRDVKPYPVEPDPPSV